MPNLGQLLMFGIEGTRMTPELKRFIVETGVGGVILFKENCESPEQIRDLIDALQDISDTPLIIGLDQEGGRVQRLPEPFTQLPAMADVGKVDGSTELARKVGELVGRELAAVGFNIDFAPVLDVNTNPGNPIIGDRSFSADAGKVAELGIEFIRGLQAQNIGACGKHFPGHGDTDLDSHLELPELDLTRERFDECEFLPFRRAIEAGVSSIMIGHLLATSLDADDPASISTPIVSGILRDEMGFDGLVFTDDLQHEGIWIGMRRTRPHGGLYRPVPT